MRTPWRWEEFRGCWAVVTGASEGIGLAYARALADRGLALALVARRAELLTAVARELERVARAEIKIFPTDLSRPGAPEGLVQALHTAGIRPRVLVNNAGAMRWGPFSFERMQEMIELNAGAPTTLCALLAPDLAASPPGAVINVGSLAGEQPIPHLAVYAATKSFLKSFSVALAEEWRTIGVRVVAVLPGFVDTGFSAKAGFSPGLLSVLKRTKPVSPDRVVALSWAGLERGCSLVYANRREKWRSWASALLPVPWVARLAGRMFRG